MTAKSWDAVWMSIADAMAQRSSCVRAQCGSVVIDPSNRIIATGYNGEPADYPFNCAAGCPHATDSPHNIVGYVRCIAIHAEANALLFCDRRLREGGTIYVSTTICIDCAKLIANSGVKYVMFRDDAPHRNGARSTDFMRDAGLDVYVWKD